MVLALNVGNTHTVVGVMDGLRPVTTLRIRTIDRTTDELGVLLLQILGNREVDPAAIAGAICGCVVPSLVYTVEKACRRYLGVDVLFVGRKLKTGMKVRTDNPREVGADRIVNGVAALARWGGPVVVVDLGTATTVDCINARGEYVGGAIAPGFRISEEALFDRTAQLPRVEVSRPASPIGRNTRHAMQSGLFWGYVGLVDSLAARCREALDPRAKVVATGGIANLIGPECAAVDAVEPHLTLHGLALLYERNQPVR